MSKIDSEMCLRLLKIVVKIVFLGEQQPCVPYPTSRAPEGCTTPSDSSQTYQSPLSTSLDPLAHVNIHFVMDLVNSGATKCFLH